VKQFNNMDSRGSSIFGRASSSDDSTCNQEEYNNSQSYRNHFFDDLRKFPEMGNAQHEAKEDVNSTMEVTNVFFRIPQTSVSGPDIKDSDNDDVVYIKSSEGSSITHANSGTEAANSPFKFAANIQNNTNNITNDLIDSKVWTKSQISQDSSTITINNITGLLKQLQLLTEKEKELLKSREEIVMDNINKNENRRRSRPQLLMKRMKCILSTSSLGLKNDYQNDKEPTSQNDNQNNMIRDPSGVSLKILQQEKLDMARESLNAVDRLRGDVIQHMPGVVRRRAQKCSSVSPSPSINGLSQDDELPLLLGRCFNLSVNMKILRQCNYADPAIGCRVFVDFDVLDNYLRRKIQETEVSLNLQPTQCEDNNSLCPRQLENQIHSLTLKNEDLCR